MTENERWDEALAGVNGYISKLATAGVDTGVTVAVLPTVQTDEPVPERTPRRVRPRTSEDIANEQTAEKLALRIWSAIVAKKVLSDATKFKERFSRAQLERMVKRDLKTRSKIVRAKLI
jgi:hypothetical protein